MRKRGRVEREEGGHREGRRKWESMDEKSHDNKAKGKTERRREKEKGKEKGGGGRTVVEVQNEST